MITPIVQKRPWLVMMIFLVVLLGVCICPSLAWAHQNVVVSLLRTIYSFDIPLIWGIAFLILLPFIFPKRTRKSAFSLCRFCVAMLMFTYSAYYPVLILLCDSCVFATAWIMSIAFVGCVLCGCWLLYELIKHGKLIVKILLPLVVFESLLCVMIAMRMDNFSVPYGISIALGVSGIYLLYVGIKEVQSWKKSIKENKK